MGYQRERHRHCERCGRHHKGRLSRIANKVRMKTGEKLCSICANKIWKLIS